MALADIRRDDRRATAQRLGFERSVRVIEQFEPSLGREFARVTEIVLRDCAQSGRQDIAWSGGLLNRNGAPLELSFSTLSDDVRYTVEVGGPETPPELRLARVDSLLEELGLDPRWGGTPRRFPELQSAGRVEWGAWLGVRHARAISSRPATTFKIYAETPAATNPAASWLVSEYLGGAPVLPEGAAELALVGGAPESDRCEFYFELSWRKPALSTLNRLLARAGLEASQDELVDLVRSFQFRREGAADTLPDAQYGFSYSLLPGGRDPVFSIFVFAADLAAGDGFVRRQVLASTVGRGWTLGCYAALTEPLAQRYFHSAFHNMLTFSVGRDPNPGLQVSVSPPPEFIHDD